MDDLPMDAATRAAVAKKMDLAASQMVIRQPFFASITLSRPLVETFTATPTFGADARGRIYYNPLFVESKDVGEISKIVFGLAHEALHIALEHTQEDELGGRDPTQANIAMDKVINEILIAEKCGTFIEGGERHPGAENMRWQDLYVEPPKGDSGGGGGPGGIGGDLIPCPDGEPSPAEKSAIREQIRVEIASAAAAARRAGKLSANLARFVDDMLQVRTPWHEITERFMTAFTQTDYSWKRPNKRFAWMGLYLPSAGREPRMGRVGLIGDTSGSISGPEVSAFCAHFNRIIETCLPEEVVVLSVDSKVCGVQRFTPDDYPVRWDPRGGGGTDMREGWRWFEESGEDYDCIICFTDGFTPWPDKVSIPSIVLSTTTQVAPDHVGETIRFDVGD